eukprot:TRINITY_DN479_c0_g1_i8.p1 TRINITY_DN479_c0_g1~~TRINITY_DN479_c0_g1_i8.p1  ORF type:complete len:105 (+),score=10.45 TRINITY_DN479_c0_g1_i8:148-462(+)
MCSNALAVCLLLLMIVMMMLMLLCVSRLPSILHVSENTEAGKTKRPGAQGVQRVCENQTPSPLSPTLSLHPHHPTPPAAACAALRSVLPSSWVGMSTPPHAAAL